jgi:hypothetical protein
MLNGMYHHHREQLRHLEPVESARPVARATNDFVGSAPIVLRALLRGEAVVRARAALKWADAGEWEAFVVFTRLATDFAVEASEVA